MSTSSVIGRDARASWRARVADYVELTKPRIVVSVAVMVAAAYGGACGASPGTPLLGYTLLGTLLVACSAGAANQWLERHRDALMARTSNRPLPAGRLTVAEAVFFAAWTGILGTVCLLWSAGWRTAAWAALTWFLYAAVYTPLKPRTSWSTALGAVAGAMPVFIGASAAGSLPSLRGVSLFLLLFLWQFPHFAAISWTYRDQYAAAGMRMLSVVDGTGRRAGLCAVLAAGATVPVSVLPSVSLPGAGGALYAVSAVALDCVQLGFAVAFLLRRDDLAARRLLHASIAHLLPLLLLLWLLSWM